MFIDTADLRQVDKYSGTGFFYGMTTNPAILERDGVPCTVKQLSILARAAFDMGCMEVQLQTWGNTMQILSSNALNLAGIDPVRVVVKLPCTAEGIKAASLLRTESDIRVTITGIYAPHQVLLAEKVGAEYAAPYLGRMNDIEAGAGTSGVQQMQQILAAHHSSCRLLVASLRDPSELALLSSKGCDTFTISPAVAAQMFAVEATEAAAVEFEAAARRMGAIDEEMTMSEDLSYVEEP